MAITSLAGWINEHYKYSHREKLTHLKVQKLAFYLYGSLLAFDFESELQPKPVEFEAWKHGPVNRELQKLFKSYGASQILNFPASKKDFSEDATRLLQDTLDIYGALDAWNIRNESHLEAPWRDAIRERQLQISHIGLKSHFKNKFCGSVLPPDNLFGLSSFRLDGIPIQSYGTLSELADVVRRVFKVA